jgi:prepilin-type N-terminal cleavage/methylation domain-containing protein
VKRSRVRRRGCRPRVARAVPGRARPLVRLRARAGMTLIELIVSIMILTTGVLALASTSAVVLRQMGGAHMQSLVSRTANSRFEQMRAVDACGSLANGSATGPGSITETWTATAITRAIQVRDSVAYSVAGEEKFQIFVTIIPCTAAT